MKCCGKIGFYKAATKTGWAAYCKKCGRPETATADEASKEDK